VLLVALFVTGRLGLPAGGRQAAFVRPPRSSSCSRPVLRLCRDHRARRPRSASPFASPPPSTSSSARFETPGGIRVSCASSWRRGSTRTRSER
jgi:hypothetical protein